MKTPARITAAALASMILLGGGAAAALAEDGVTSPAVQEQQSNIGLVDADFTEEITLKAPTGAYEKPSRAEDSIYQVRNAPAPEGYPMPATPTFKGADGFAWVAVTDYAYGKYGGQFYIPASAVALSAPAGTFQAARDAEAETLAAAHAIHMKAFSGTGIVKPGAGWRATEDASAQPVAVAQFPGLEAPMSEPYSVGSEKWRKLHGTDTAGKDAVFFVRDADVKNFKTDAPATPTAAPEVVPEGIQSADAVSSTVGAGQPNNLGVAFALGGFVLVAGGGYWTWDRKRKAVTQKAGGAEEAAGQES
ncbi:hypothetical protein [Arthrobacter sp. STN4]|uniref:hypothetical protein n=1 Tax=Arthrobacter sp. STN4 TaxID=2923276 RepID=UPI00211A27B8|nr:hypothetical protein [Arthrobacter sp. STN4]MCQ9162928.1 hypothetical protein [Arthrobacter sp. STN4]